MTQDGVKYDMDNLPEGLIIKGNVVFPNIEGLNILPDMSTVTVYGHFNCSGLGLKTLKGAPKRVEGDFICSYNKLKTLDGGPQYVGGNYDCSFANLKSLKGAAEYVGGDFNCRGSRENEGSYYGPGVADFENEYDDWDAEDANILNTVKGAPKYVGRTFNCAMNYITTLKGGPEYVGGDFVCFRNCLKSLKWLPKYCGGEVVYYDNNITDNSAANIDKTKKKVTVKVLLEKKKRVR